MEMLSCALYCQCRCVVYVVFFIQSIQELKLSFSLLWTLFYDLLYSKISFQLILLKIDE